MSDDKAEIVGNWTVSFKAWVWQYTFSNDGGVTWVDPLNNEKGTGRWMKVGQLVNISWNGSTTKESWHCPIKSAGQTGWVQASYGTGPMKAQKITAAPSPPGSLTQGDPNEEPLESGPFYNDRKEYIDNVVSGQYDPQSGQFLVRHADGTDIEIDIHKIRRGALIVPMFGSSITELYVFYRNRRDGKIYPRVFDENSTPNLVLMAREIAEALPGAVALRQIGHAILDLIEWMSLKPNMSRGVGRKAWRVKPRTLRDTASALVRQLRKAGKRIRVNLGGTGEVADAINLNPNRVAPRADIPNLLQGEGENIGDLFEAGSVDEIVSNRLPPNTINWNQVIPGAAKVLRSGGRIVIKFQGVGEDARIIVEAMKAAKFRNIQNMADAVIEAIR